MQSPNWDPQAHADRVKFMLAISKQTFESPAEMIMGQLKLIATTLVVYGKDDAPTEQLEEVVEDCCEALRRYVSETVNNYRRLKQARNGKAN